ncbi:hypothetical protein B0T20DRAFT_499007 [Sordaria brevicollis]|uniref:Ketoreductase (KR) domain-containing protein n=1 Tax=Sordaria brevicollis TaxID=83679 RepID=A0AAE0PFD7_SORBR|nr:hypothetical protein B0T20DRAFT_499007 [Sordaria brevicollis]
MPTYVITGANRGIGLEFIRQLSQSPDNTILALVRSTSKDHSALKSLASSSSSNSHVHILECDTSSLSSIRDFAKSARSLLSSLSSPSSLSSLSFESDGKKIDYIINNAAINLSPQNSSLQLAPDDLLTSIKTNVLGPAKLVEFLLQQELLSENVRVQNMSSGLGSLQRTVEGEGGRQCAGYSISKAALNMLSLHLAGDLRREGGLKGAVVVVMDPGWVRTDMGGQGAVLSPEESVRGQLKVLHGLEREDNGGFFGWEGGRVPW